jgi:predicted pyridoxine 5'-phosphate oxidase superfamily flavin-nucleotide-binding protein
MLTPDMRAVIQAAHLCFAATVTSEGRPNLSPKGTIGVWDDAHLFFLDLASPGTRANLAQNPYLELNVVEQLSRRGYRFAGPAALYFARSPEYAPGVRRIYDDAPPPAAPTAVVVVTVERVAPLLSPAYWRGTDETEIRKLWRERRATLDREFEAYLAQVAPVRVSEPAT